MYKNLNNELVFRTGRILRMLLEVMMCALPHGAVNCAYDLMQSGC